MASFLWIKVRGKEAVNKLLEDAIEHQLNESHKVTFRGFDLSVITNTISISHIEFSKSDSSGTSKNVVITVPQLEIRILSAWDILFGKEVKIQSIAIYNPSLALANTRRSQNPSLLTWETGTIYQAISKHLRLLSIKDFDLKNGHVSFTQDSTWTHFDNIDLSIRNFFLKDSTRSLDKFLYSDKIELIMTDQKFPLPDGAHTLSFDKLSVITSTGDITIENLDISKIHPLTNDVFTLLQIPRFTLNGLDFNKAYTQGELHLKGILIKRPKLRLNNQTKTGTLPIHKTLAQIFGSIRADKIKIENGILDLIYNQAHRRNHLTSTDLTFEIENFAMNASEPWSEDWHELIGNINLTVRDFSGALADSTHSFATDHLSYSSTDNHLELGKTIFISKNHQKNFTELSITAEGLMTSEISPITELSQGIFRSKKIRTKQPSITLATQGAINGDSTFQKLIRLIQTKRLEVVDGSLNIQTPSGSLDTKGIYITLENLKLNQEFFRKLELNEITNSASIKTQHFSLRHPKVSIEFEGSTLENWQNLSLHNLEINPANEKQHLKSKTLQITHLNLSQLLQDQQLTFDTLLMLKPKAELYTKDVQHVHTDNLSKWTHDINFHEISIIDGELIKGDSLGTQLHLHNFDMELTEFHYDAIHQEYFIHIGAAVDSFFLRSDDAMHRIQGKDLQLSIQDSSLSVHNLTLLPYKNDTTSQFLLQSPKLTLDQINFHRLINERQLHFQHGKLTNPEASIHLSPSEENKAPQRSDQALIKYESFEISNGKLALKNPNSTLTNLTVGELDLEISEFELDHDSSIFGAQNYCADMRNITFHLPNNHRPLAVENIRINTIDGDLSIEGMNLFYDSALSFQIPKMFVSGFNPMAYAHYQSLELDSLTIDAPAANISPALLANHKMQKKPSAIPSIKINHLFMKNGEVNLLVPGINFGNSLNLKEVDLSIQDFLIDSSITTLEIADLFKSLNLSIPNIHLKSPDSLYRFSGDLQKDSSIITISNLSMIPTYDKQAFQEQIAYQTEWFDGCIDELTVHDVDYFELLQRHYLKIQRIDLNRLYLNTHKDKRLPLPPNLEKPLPQQTLSLIPFTFYIHEISMDSAGIYHSEFSPTGNLPGDIHFNNLNATLTDFTNDPKKLKKQPILGLNATGTLMETGHFTVNVDFDMTDSSQFFIFQGELKDMDLTELNMLLENTAFVHIKNGHNKYVTFDFEANHDYAIGNMKFHYHDLKIKVLNPDDMSLHGHGASIKTFFANTFVVSKKNPNLVFVREGDIFHHHDPGKAIFNYWAKALLSGVISSIGAKNNRKEIRRLNKDLKTELDRKRAEILRKRELTPYKASKKE